MRKNGYLGIMVSIKMFNKIPNAKGYLKKVLSLYEEAAEKYKVTLCFFPISKIDFEQKNLVGYSMKGKKGYFLETIPIPRAIYRRGRYRKTFEPLVSLLLND